MFSSVKKAVKNVVPGSGGSGGSGFDFGGLLTSGLTAGIGALGGALSVSSSNRAAREMAQMQADLQREFAQNAIQWKVDDAKKAGLHPLAALGISTASYSPVTSSYTSPFSGISDMAQSLGQNIDRARMAGMDRDQRREASALSLRQTALSLRNQELQNDILETELASRRARLSQQLTPAAPPLRPLQKGVVDGQDGTVPGTPSSVPPPSVAADGQDGFGTGPHAVRMWKMPDGTAWPMPAEEIGELYEGVPGGSLLPIVHTQLSEWQARLKYLTDGTPWDNYIFDPDRYGWLDMRTDIGRNAHARIQAERRYWKKRDNESWWQLLKRAWDSR